MRCLEKDKGQSPCSGHDSQELLLSLYIIYKFLNIRRATLDLARARLQEHRIILNYGTEHITFLLGPEVHTLPPADVCGAGMWPVWLACPFFSSWQVPLCVVLPTYDLPSLDLDATTDLTFITSQSVNT